MRGSWASSATRRRASTAARPRTRARRSRRWSSSPTRGPASAGWRPPAGRAWWRARSRRGRAPCTASTSRPRWSSWRGARRPALENATFSVGDATALPDPDGAYDGAIARFTLHHVPVPARLVEELARVVRPGGAVVLADHLLDEDPEAAAWSAEIERLRDPSHWASLPLERLRALGADAGLELEREEISPLALDLGDWLERGSGTAAARPLLERLMAAPPAGARRFTIRDGTVLMTWWAARFRRPGGPSPG